MKKVGCVAWGKHSQRKWPGSCPGAKRAGQRLSIKLSFITAGKLFQLTHYTCSQSIFVELMKEQKSLPLYFNDEFLVGGF